MSELIGPDHKIAEARDKLVHILAKAVESDCSKFLGKLKSVQKIRRKVVNRKSNFKYWISVTFIGLFLILYCNVLSHEKFSTFWMKINYGDVNNDKCTIRMPDEVVKIFRPPVACSMCADVTQVDRVANITPEQFEIRYAYSGRPVIVSDGMRGWTAQHVFSYAYLKKIYMNRMESWSRFNCQFFPYRTEFRHLKEVFNMTHDRAYMMNGSTPWYVGWSNCDYDVSIILRRHYERPYFLPHTAESRQLDWIFMGSFGYGAPLHVDNVEHPSWQAQLMGTKKWILEPPPECYYYCHRLEAVVNAGDIIVVDTNQWYHSTLIVSKEISITIGAEYD